MKRVVLTGATGFVGANLVRRLLSDGHEVHLLLRKEYKPWRINSVMNDVNIHIIDLNDREALERLIPGIRPEWIFHLAAYGAYSTQSNFRRLVDTNLMATANLVDVCVQMGFEAFINTGSSSEYGYKDHAPSETEWLEPNSNYAVLKAAATHYCRNVALSKKVNISTFRLYSVFGPYEEPTRLIPTLIIEGLRGKLPPLVNPDIARDFVYVDDVTNAYLKAASHSSTLMGEIFNIGSGVQTTLKQAVEVTRNEFAIKTEPVWGSMKDRNWDTSIWVANIDRANLELNWQPQSSFSDGFNQFAKWMKSDPKMLVYYQVNRQYPV